jgi:hypothetical protein
MPSVVPDQQYTIAVESFSSSDAPIVPFSIVCPSLPIGASVYSSVVKGSYPILLNCGKADLDRPLDASHRGLELRGADLLQNTTLNIQFHNLNGGVFPSATFGNWGMMLVVLPIETIEK